MFYRPFPKKIFSTIIIIFARLAGKLYQIVTLVERTTKDDIKISNVHDNHEIIGI